MKATMTTSGPERSDRGSRTHRCIDCPLPIEHYQDELCPSCGRCPTHCQGMVGELGQIPILGHVHMKRVWEA